MTTPEDQIVTRYFEAFEVPPSEREAVLTALFAPGAYYCDPLTEATTTGERMAMADELQERFPGASVVRTSDIDHHHNQIRYEWKMVGSDGEMIADGIDVLVYDKDHRVTHALGFFGRTAPPLSRAE